MANFKIFQDSPDQARVKIYGSNNTALNTDSLGNLTITSTGLAITAPANGLAITSTGLAVTAPTNGLTVTASADGLAITPPSNGLAITSTGLAITAPANGLAITSTGLAITAPTNGLTVTASADGLAITPPSNGLAITSTGLAITAPTNGLTVTAPASGLSITPPTNGILITSPGLAIATGTTDVSAVRANITDTAGSGDTTYDVLGVPTWTFGVVNSATVANAQALVTLQISPDGTNWLNEAGPVTINQNSLTSLVSSVFLKYARVFYSAVNAASAVTLNIYFQGQM